MTWMCKFNSFLHLKIVFRGSFSLLLLCPLTFYFTRLDGDRRGNLLGANNNKLYFWCHTHAFAWLFEIFVDFYCFFSSKEVHFSYSFYMIIHIKHQYASKTEIMRLCELGFLAHTARYRCIVYSYWSKYIIYNTHKYMTVQDLCSFQGKKCIM